MLTPKRLEEMKALAAPVPWNVADKAEPAVLRSYLRDAIAEIEELQARLRPPAPACSACKNDDHTNACGGLESGCGCAARRHT